MHETYTIYTSKIYHRSIIDNELLSSWHLTFAHGRRLNRGFVL